MSGVIKVKEVRRSGHLVIDTDGTRTYHRTYLVWTDVVMGPGEMYLQASNPNHSHEGETLPAKDAPYFFALTSPPGALPESDPVALVANINPVRHPDDRLLWTVDIEYITLPGYELQDGELSVEGVLPEIRFGHVTKEVVVDEDINNNLIENTIGEPYDRNHPVRKRNKPLLTVEINLKRFSYNPVTAMSYIGSINTDVIFGGVAAHQAMLMAWGGRRSIHSTQAGHQLYWEEDIEIHFDKDTFLRKVVNAGFQKRNPEYQNLADLVANPAKARVRIFDGAGLPVNKPLPLNAGGEVLAEGADPVFNTFHIEPEKAFEPIGLPPLVIDLNPPANP